MLHCFATLYSCTKIFPLFCSVLRSFDHKATKISSSNTKTEFTGTINSFETMPSRPISGNPRATAAILKSKILFVATTLSLTAVIFSTLIYIFYHLWSSLFQRSRTRPFEEIPPLKQLLRFTYKELKSATNSFDPENAIGKGGSGSVFRGILRDGKSVAVKLLDPSASLQAEKEFQNELTILSGIKSPLIVSLIGYCVYKNKRILVYEYMPNHSLQELLFCDGKSLGCNVVGWDRRFRIIQDVCGALEFLHNECDPPVIHGDIKPSNVLLDWDYKAKVCDFGLSRLKVESGDNFGDDFLSQDLDRSEEMSPNLAMQASTSSKNGCLSCFGDVARESVAKRVDSPKGKEALRLGVLADELCVGNVEHYSGVSKDWWWKQDGGSDEVCSKDYVMEWIGSQICAGSSPEMNLEKASAAATAAAHKQVISMKKEKKKQPPKKMQEWWKQESLEEMSRKGGGSKKTKLSCKPTHFKLGQCFHHMTKGGGGGSRRRRFSKETEQNGKSDVFSRELSSNTSMRGTLCYAAPEFGGSSGFLMEKSDIYSLGVLMLVIVSGRRPLNVLNPGAMEKANLVSWCRQLAHSGNNLLELVDERLNGLYNRQQAALCINLALTCLQRMPEMRPDIRDIVRILEGEMDVPQLHFEFSPSPGPSCKSFSSSRRKHKKKNTTPDSSVYSCLV